MTQQITTAIKRNWGVLVIIGTIFAMGWYARDTFSRELASVQKHLSGQIDAKVGQVENRVNERIGRMRDDVRDIRNLLYRAYGSPAHQRELAP